MLQYTFKTYIFGGVEHYVYGEAYADDTVISSQAVTFPDSLLSWRTWILTLWSPLSRNSMMRFGS